jgi:hypothetical protein
MNHLSGCCRRIAVEFPTNTCCSAQRDNNDVFMRAGPNSHPARFALVVALLFLGCSCQRVHVPVAQTPAAGTPAVDWQPPEHVPPRGCAVVPAAAKGTPTPGEKEGAVPASPGQPAARPDNWPAQFQIPGSEAKNFSGAVTPRVLKAGSVLYRVIGAGGNPTGAYWTNRLPAGTEADWRATFAVFSWWNGGSCLERYIVPKHRVVRLWEGMVAPQMDEGRPGYYLIGGAWQYWVPASNTQIDPALIEYAHSPWAASQTASKP